jgi:hypothetical protein
MRTRPFLLLLLAGAVLLAPALALSATSPARTELDVFVARTTPGLSTEHVVDVDVAASAGAVERLQLFVPAGYTAALPPPGTTFGDATATFHTATALVRVAAPITADDPSKHTADACAPGPHAAVWVSAAAIGGQPAPLTFYVDPAPAGIAEHAAYVLQACFDAPATSGRQLASLRLDLRGVLTTPQASGRYLWRVLLTPYGTNGAPAAEPATEAQALLPLPYRLTVRARYDKTHHRVSFSGTATAGRSADADTPVQILVVTPKGFTAFGVTRTDGRGRFAFTKRLLKTTRFALLAGDAAFSDCEPTLGPAPCTLETLSPSELRVVNVTVPR